MTTGATPAEEMPLRERLREALGHDELPSDDGLVADVYELVRLVYALGQPVPDLPAHIREDFPEGVYAAVRLAQADVAARGPGWRTTRALLALIDQSGGVHGPVVAAEKPVSKA